MKAVLKGIVYVLVAVVVVIVGGAYLIPPVAKVERATTINAPPDKVYAIVASMKRFNDWSPWFGLDPGAAYTFEGPQEGAGQKMNWTSKNPSVGNGSMTITEAVPDQKVATELDFGEMGKARASFALAPASGGTAVTWGFESDVNGVMERWMSLMFDKWIGADYEKGLANLKALAEKEAAAGG